MLFWPTFLVQVVKNVCLSASGYLIGAVLSLIESFLAKRFTIYGRLQSRGWLNPSAAIRLDLCLSLILVWIVVGYIVLATRTADSRHHLIVGVLLID